MNASADAASWNGLDYRSAQGGVDLHHNVPYNSLPNRSYSYTSQGRSITSVPNEIMHSVSMDRGSNLQRSIPMSNPVANQVTSRQMLGNASMRQHHVQNMYATSQEMTSNTMMQRNAMIQNQMPHGYAGQNISANGINTAYGM